MLKIGDKMKELTELEIGTAIKNALKENWDYRKSKEFVSERDEEPQIISFIQIGY